MLKAMAVLVSFSLMSISTALAETTITLFFTNSDGEIKNLRITDNVCNRSMFSGHFAVEDFKRIDEFCVRHASNLVAEISISADGDDKSPSGTVPANSNVDVASGQVTPSRLQKKQAIQRLRIVGNNTGQVVLGHHEPIFS